MYLSTVPKYNFEVHEYFHFLLQLLVLLLELIHIRCLK